MAQSHSSPDHTRDPHPAPMPPVRAPEPPPPQTPPPPTEQEAARHRELFLRFQGQGKPLTEAEKKELDAFQLAESKEAGHVVAPPEAPMAPGEQWILDLLTLVGDIIATLPQLNGMVPRLDQMRVRFGDLHAKK